MSGEQAFWLIGFQIHQTLCGRWSPHSHLWTLCLVDPGVGTCTCKSSSCRSILVPGREQGDSWGEDLATSFWPWSILHCTLLQDGRDPFAPHSRHIRHLRIMLIWDMCTEPSYSAGSVNILGLSGKDSEDSRALNQQAHWFAVVTPAGTTFLARAEPETVLASVAQKQLLPSCLPVTYLPSLWLPFRLDSPRLLLQKLPLPEVELDKFRMHSQGSSLCLLNLPDPCPSNPP